MNTYYPIAFIHIIFILFSSYFMLILKLKHIHILLHIYTLRVNSTLLMSLKEMTSYVSMYVCNVLKCITEYLHISLDNRLEPIMPKNLPAYYSFPNLPKFLPNYSYFILIAPPFIPFLFYCVYDNITMQE